MSDKDAKMPAAKKNSAVHEVLCRAIDRKPNISVPHTLEHFCIKRFISRALLLPAQRR